MAGRKRKRGQKQPTVLFALRLSPERGWERVHCDSSVDKRFKSRFWYAQPLQELRVGQSWTSMKKLDSASKCNTRVIGEDLLTMVDRYWRRLH